MTGAWRLALRNLGRNQRRNLATGFAVALGYAGLVLLGGYKTAVDGYIRTETVYLGHLGHVAIFKEGGLEAHLVKPRQFSLSREEQEAIASLARAQPEVELVERALDGTGLAGNGCKTVPFIARGIDAEIDRQLRANPEVMRWVPRLAGPSRGVNLAGAGKDVAGPMMLSEGLARRLGKSRVSAEVGPAPAGQTVPDCASPDLARLLASDANVQLAGVTFDGGFSAVDGDMVGIYSTGQSVLDDSSVLTTVERLQLLYDTDHVTQISLYLRDGTQAGAVARRLESALAERGLAVDAYAYDDARANEYYVGTVELLGMLVGFMTVIIGVVVVLSVVNSMTMALIERTREIGTFRSIGFTRHDVVGLFVRETVALASLGLVIGLGVGLGAAAGLNAANIPIMPPGVPSPIPLRFFPTALPCAALAAAMLILCVLTSWVLSRRRARVNIVTLNTAIAG